VEGDLQPRADLTLVITRKNGEVVKVPMTCRLDTAKKSRCMRLVACCSASHRIFGR
jgi:aconitase A